MEFKGFSQEFGKIVYVAENGYREEEPVCKSCGVELEAYCTNAYCDLVCPVCGYRERLPKAHPCPLCGRPAAPSYCPHCGWRGEEAAYDESLPREKKVKTHLTHEESKEQLQYLLLNLQKAPDDPYTLMSGVAEAVRIKRSVPPEYADLVAYADGCVVFKCGARYCNGRWEADVGISDVAYALGRWGKPKDVELAVEGDCVVYNGQRFCGGVPEELMLVATVGKCYDVRMAKLAEALGVYSASSIRRAVERVKGEKARLQDDIDSTPHGVVLYENPLLNLALCLGVDENAACAAFVEQYIANVLCGGEVKCLKEGKKACRGWRDAVGRRLLKYVELYLLAELSKAAAQLLGCKPVYRGGAFHCGGKSVSIQDVVKAVLRDNVAAGNEADRKVRRPQNCRLLKRLNVISREVLAMLLTAAYAAVTRGEMQREDFRTMVLMLYDVQPKLKAAYELFTELWMQSAKYDNVVVELKKLEESLKQQV